ncbi:MAG TPA: guanylate kinase [Advenella kashmirensis]|uniref:Guanylate kinase n=1 Tax=Advenella kashmirensis TaxID=310575 RepID=A0A356LHG1_9BURK|nr:guanylate kinase [Advenella kashmirensis]
MIIAPSGAGKSSLVNALLAQDNNISLSISCTTRDPRPSEQDGREYYFTTKQDFLQLRETDQLLEWAEVHGNFYGTPRPPIEKAIAQGKDILLEIDWQGARQVRQHFPGVMGIFILPPSIEVLETRLAQRGQDSPSVITRRILAAGSEIAHAPECEYVIINEDFAIALNELQKIVAAARLRYQSQAARHAQLFSQLGISDSVR